MNTECTLGTNVCHCPKHAPAPAPGERCACGHRWSDHGIDGCHVTNCDCRIEWRRHPASEGAAVKVLEQATGRVLSKQTYENTLRGAAFCHKCDAPAMESYLTPLLAHDAALRAEVERLTKERYALLDIKSTDGLSCSEWMLRTALAEAQRDALLKALREVFSEDESLHPLGTHAARKKLAAAIKEDP